MSASWITGPAPRVDTHVAPSTSTAATCIAFSTTIPFTANAYMRRVQVRSALTFVPLVTSHSKANVTVDLELVADGVNAPSFPGFKQLSTSIGYLNTAGAINYVRCWFSGPDVLYAIWQANNPVGAPRALASAVTSANECSVLFSKTLSSSVMPTLQAISLNNSLDAVQRPVSVQTSGSTLVLTFARPIATGTLPASPAVVSLTYSNAGILSADGEYAGDVTQFAVSVTITGAPVNTVAPALSTTTPLTGTAVTVSTGTWTNSPTSYAYQWYYADANAIIADATASSYTPVSADGTHTLACTVTAVNAVWYASANSNASGLVAVYTRLTASTGNGTSPVALVETVNGSGYNYGTPTDSAGYSNGSPACGITTTKLRSSQTSGYARITYGGRGASVDGIIFGISHQSYVGNFQVSSPSYPSDWNMDFGVYSSAYGGQNNVYWVIIMKNYVQAVNTVTGAANDLLQMRRSGNSFIVEVSKNGGSSFTTLYTWNMTGAFLTYDYNLLVTMCAPQQGRLPTTQNFT